MKRRFFILLAAFVGLCGLTGATLVFFQDNLARYFLNPRKPYQTVVAPEAPDYSYPNHWAAWPGDDPNHGSENDAIIDPPNGEITADIMDDSLPADIFFVHDTTFSSRQAWNSPIDDSIAAALVDNIALPNGAGPFVNFGDLYAPRYRQATLFTKFTHKYDSLAAQKLAFDDIRAAFQHYVSKSNPDRPLLLVGYGQGAFHALGILSLDIANDPVLKRRLTAAYLIGHAIPVSASVTSDDQFTPCRHENDFGCFITFTAFEERARRDIKRVRLRTLIWAAQGFVPTNRGSATAFPESIVGEAILCHNPLSGPQDERGYIAAKFHRGAASATGLPIGESPVLIDQEVGARCDDGVLIVDQPQKGFLRRSYFWGSQWRSPPFNLFYADLREDARKRLEQHRPVLADQVRDLPPIGGVVDLEENPIKKVPN